MTKTEFINGLRKMADELENGNPHMMRLDSGYIFGNKNFGESRITISDGVWLSFMLYLEEGEK